MEICQVRQYIILIVDGKEKTFMEIDDPSGEMQLFP